RRKRVSSDAARARTASSSFAAPSVRFATTSTSFTGSASSSFAGRPRDARACTRGGGGRWGEDPVHGAGDAVLVRTAHDGRYAVEVEHGRRRADLPLQGQPAPRVGHGPRAASPA